MPDSYGMASVGELARGFMRGFIQGRQLKQQRRAEESDRLGRRLQFIGQMMNDPSSYRIPEGQDSAPADLYREMFVQTLSQMDELEKGKKSKTKNEKGGITGFFSRIFGGGGGGQEEPSFADQLLPIMRGQGPNSSDRGDLGLAAGNIAPPSPQLASQGAPRRPAPISGFDEAGEMPRAEVPPPAAETPQMPSATQMLTPQQYLGVIQRRFSPSTPTEIIDREAKRHAPEIVSSVRQVLDGYRLQRGFKTYQEASQDPEFSGYLNLLDQWGAYSGQRDLAQNYLQLNFREWQPGFTQERPRTADQQVKDMEARIMMQGGAQTPEEENFLQAQLDYARRRAEAGHVASADEQRRTQVFEALRKPRAQRTPADQTSIDAYRSMSEMTRPQTTINMNEPKPGLSKTGQLIMRSWNSRAGKYEELDIPVTRTGSAAQMSKTIEVPIDPTKEFGPTQKVTVLDAGKVQTQHQLGERSTEGIDDETLYRLAVSGNFASTGEKLQVYNYAQRVRAARGMPPLPPLPEAEDAARKITGANAPPAPAAKPAATGFKFQDQP